MSSYSDIKLDFHSELLKGSCPIEGYESVPYEIRDRWTRKFYATPKWLPRLPERVLNHFLVGADPEFLFMDNAGGGVDASVLGLQQAQAFGADNSGRQCEIRPTPSRSTLDVVASMASTLRWLSILKPRTRQVAWRSGCYVAHDGFLDGLGGHVHFGRKRPQAERERQALDTLCFRLFHIGVFNQAEGAARLLNTKYGRLGDVRAQKHGYEYRAFPSWLDNAYLAFMTLTLSKLAVLDPNLWPKLQVGDDKSSVAEVQSKLRAILAHFKPLDDDAALAFGLLERRGWPTYDVSDFKREWGIPKTPPAQNYAGIFIPGSIRPTLRTRQEVLEALWQRRNLTTIPEEPNWQPQYLPKGYSSLIDHTKTKHLPGLGELVFDLATHQLGEHKLEMSAGRHLQNDADIYVSSDYCKAEVIEMVKLVAPGLKVVREARRVATIYVDLTKLSDPKSRLELRKALVDSGAFPIWPVATVSANSLMFWKNLQATKPEAKAAVAKPISKTVCHQFTHEELFGRKF